MEYINKIIELQEINFKNNKEIDDLIEEIYQCESSLFASFNKDENLKNKKEELFSKYFELKKYRKDNILLEADKLLYEHIDELDDKATLELAKLYDEGPRNNLSYYKAKSLFTRLFDLKNEDALYYIHKHIIEELEQDFLSFDFARDYNFLFSRRNDLNSLYLMAKLYESGDLDDINVKKAFHLYKLCANKGIKGAIEDYNRLIYDGVEEEIDIKKRTEEVLKIDNRGYALYLLGRGYQLLDEPDYSKAIMCYKEAIKFGFSSAYYQLSYLYFNGLGCIKDKKLASDYFIVGAQINDKTELSSFWNRIIGYKILNEYPGVLSFGAKANNLLARRCRALRNINSPGASINFGCEDIDYMLLKNDSKILYAILHSNAKDYILKNTIYKDLNNKELDLLGFEYGIVEKGFDVIEELKNKNEDKKIEEIYKLLYNYNDFRFEYYRYLYNKDEKEEAIKILDSLIIEEYLPAFNERLDIYKMDGDYESYFKCLIKETKLEDCPISILKEVAEIYYYGQDIASKYNGYYLKKDDEKALYYANKINQMSYAFSANPILGNLYFEGWVVGIDYVKAYQCYGELKEANKCYDVMEALHLAMMYENGLGGAEKSHQLAKEFIKRAEELKKEGYPYFKEVK